MAFENGASFQAIHRWAVARAMALAIVYLSPFLIIGIGAVAAIAYYLQAFWIGGTVFVTGGLIACILISAFCMWIVHQNLSTLRVARLVPCFRQSVGDISTFERGACLARHARRLDELADQFWKRRLSAFGLSAREGRERSPRWYPAQEGIDTVSALMQAVPDDPQLADAADQIIADLQTILDALCKADERGIAFRMVLRLGDDAWINPMEMDSIDGTFW
jgi:hypothetical protein